jgi:hypothetical protein
MIFRKTRYESYAIRSSCILVLFNFFIISNASIVAVRIYDGMKSRLKLSWHYVWWQVLAKHADFCRFE